MVSVYHGSKIIALDGSGEAPTPAAELTPRENEIMSEIAVGQTSKEVARSLAISPRTVEFHRANLLKKFKAKNTADLVRKISGRLPAP